MKKAKNVVMKTTKKHIILGSDTKGMVFGRMCVTEKVVVESSPFNKTLCHSSCSDTSKGEN